MDVQAISDYLRSLFPGAFPEEGERVGRGPPPYPTLRERYQKTENRELE